MLLLNQTATLYKRTGQSGGKPAYASTGVPFTCRAQDIDEISAAARGYSGRADVRIFAPPQLAAEAGDRVAFADGGSALIAQVNRRRGATALHHLEILARREG